MSTSEEDRQAGTDWHWDRGRDEQAPAGSLPRVQQVGGSHYGDHNSLGHWDLMEKYDIAYLEGNATKYMSRWRRKGKPVEDLEKAISYLEKMGGRPIRRSLSAHVIATWAIAQDLDVWDHHMIVQVLATGYGTSSDIAFVITELRLKAEEIKANEPQQS